MPNILPFPRLAYRQTLCISSSYTDLLWKSGEVIFSPFFYVLNVSTTWLVSEITRSLIYNAQRWLITALSKNKSIKVFSSAPTSPFIFFPKHYFFTSAERENTLLYQNIKVLYWYQSLCAAFRSLRWFFIILFPTYCWLLVSFLVFGTP